MTPRQLYQKASSYETAAAKLPPYAEDVMRRLRFSRTNGADHGRPEFTDKSMLFSFVIWNAGNDWSIIARYRLPGPGSITTSFYKKIPIDATAHEFENAAGLVLNECMMHASKKARANYDELLSALKGLE